MLTGHTVLTWFHVILVAYWLGAEWGVFNASTNVANPALTLEERRRHLEVAFRIDIVPRTAIVLLLPAGMTMAANIGLSSIKGAWLILVWAVFIGWLPLVWAAYRHRGTPKGTLLTIIDERFRYVLIPLLWVASISSLVAGEPFHADWVAAKVGIFGILLSIGLLLRWTMRAWVTGFRSLASEGSTPATEALISGTLARARRFAYVYWALIGTNAFLGETKPF